ncbi:MAG: hypothetical protein SPK64_04090 [Candidatus Enterosoma sp.]|nr:hypothetical protein [Candidatus Enterosoma sp.]
MTRRRSYQLSLFFNSLIFVLECFVICNRFLGFIPYSDTLFSLYDYTAFYNLDVVANVLLALSSFAMMIREIKYLNTRKDCFRKNTFLTIFKLSSIVMSLISFGLLACYYYPVIKNENIVDFLFDFHYNLWAFLVLPWLSLVSFIFFDRDKKTKFRFSFFVILPIIAYLAVFVVLDYIDILAAPFSIISMKDLQKDSNMMEFLISVIGSVIGGYLLGSLVLLYRNHLCQVTYNYEIDIVNLGVDNFDYEVIDHTIRKDLKKGRSKKSKEAEKEENKEETKNKKKKKGEQIA